jgi:hypothetical protein
MARERADPVRRAAVVSQPRETARSSRTMTGRAVTVTGIVLMFALMAGAGSAAAPPLTPLVSDWERYLRVDAETATRDGRTVVSGTVWNIGDWSAKRIQLLVEGLDAAGQPVIQRVVWLGMDLPAGSHAYFEVPMATAMFYRVSVFAFDSSRGRWGG